MQKVSSDHSEPGAQGEDMSKDTCTPRADTTGWDCPITLQGGGVNANIQTWEPTGIYTCTGDTSIMQDLSLLLAKKAARTRANIKVTVKELALSRQHAVVTGL